VDLFLSAVSLRSLFFIRTSLGLSQFNFYNILALVISIPETSLQIALSSKAFIWLQSVYLDLMSLKYAVCMLIIAATVLNLGCISSDEAGGEGPRVPTENLPEGFTLVAVIDGDTQGINIEDEIADFRGDEDIGAVRAAIGIYQWAEMGTGYDSKITVMDCEDEAKAEAAVSNYVGQPKFEKPPFVGVDRFSTAVVNGREVTEIRSAVGKELKYIYIWNDGNQVVLVEGNGDRAESLELASATASR
jgi:hypothetical protein